MSRPSALPSPRGRASRPAPMAPPAGPERTLQAPARAASSAVATPPEDCITSGSRQPGAGRGLAEAAEVAAEQGREIGVDRRGRAALVLAEAGQHLVRGGDVERRAARGAGARRCARSWRRVEVGEEQADRDRLGAALAQQLGQPARLPRRRAARSTPSGRPARRPRSAARRRPGASASARRGGRGWAGPGGRSRARRRSRGWRSARCGRRVPPAGRWCRLSSHGRRPRPSAPSRPARSQHLLDRGDHRARLVIGRGRQLRRVELLAVEEDGVGEGPAYVDPEQHASKLPSSAPALAADLAVGAEHEVDRRRAPGRPPGKSLRRWPPRDSRRSRAAVRDRRWRAGRGRRAAAPAAPGPRQRAGQLPDRLAGRLVGGSKRHSPGSGGWAARLSPRAARPRLGRRRRSTR